MGASPYDPHPVPLAARRTPVMLPSRRLAALIVILSAAVMPCRADTDKFFFQDGDTVVMLGDSITEQHLYSSYVEAWTVTRFPAWKIVFRNVGIGGDRS